MRKNNHEMLILLYEQVIMSGFSNEIIRWYNENKRDLPWRNTKDPYKIWLSEIILQQTRVAQGLSYYEKFIEQFPTVESLANAPLNEVLRLWQGLGYYTRARNIHKAAQQVVANFKGEFPNNYKDLLSLSGIGDYTASAISSIAFDEAQAVVDGNVYRVLSRVFGIKEDISSGKGVKYFRTFAQKTLPSQDYSTYNQAIMEFGALQCVPQNPSCDQCPLSGSCYALANKSQSELPVKNKKTKVKERLLVYLVFMYNNELLMQQRPSKGIWAEMYDFFCLENPKKIGLTPVLEYPEGIDNSKIISKKIKNGYKHILSHQILHVDFFLIELNEKIVVEGYEYYTSEQVEKLPKSVLINNYLKELDF